MASLRPDLVKRLQCLPKPTNAAGALQPLFEAVSNAIHSTQALFGEDVTEQGEITVTVSISRTKDKTWASVEDNGAGLDEGNWEAFTTTDTDHKIDVGGKGVGRLLWLDCFENTAVTSTYREGKALKLRKFRFLLSKENQIQDDEVKPATDSGKTGFCVRFDGLRANGYREKFPGRASYIFQHFTSHFLPTLISGRSPSISVDIGGESRRYPGATKDIIHRSEDGIALETDAYGKLSMTLMECDKVASADLKGTHFVHFIAHDRTVHSQAIDKKLGLRYFGENQDRVFHAILTGEFLDRNVNQERTAFASGDEFIERIICETCMPHIESFLEGPLLGLRQEQYEIIEGITAAYPSVAFGNPRELQDKVPSGELHKDAIYSHLARERFRRDERQTEKIMKVLSRLKGDALDAEAFASIIPEATKALEDAEQRSLAEYVVRRKFVLDFIERLLEKVRDDGAPNSYQREEILHSLICPVGINNVSGEGSRRVAASASHNLWVVDERLTFAEYFSSDVDFRALSETYDSSERADILVFDYVHGLKNGAGNEASSKVLLVDFKRPAQKSQQQERNPQLQIQRHVKHLQSGKLNDVRGRPIRLDENTVFYCYIVADIVGHMDELTDLWQKTPDGRRILRPDSGFKGSIELIGWDTLIEDARARNKAFFDRAGIPEKNFFE